MTKKVAVLWVSLIVAGLAGCGGSLSRPDGSTGTGGTGGGNIPPELRAQLDAASAAWAASKPACRVYSYDRRWSSVFGGATSTEVEIQNDVPTRRRYSTGNYGDGGSGWTLVWEETGSQVGQQQGGTLFGAFPASTMEQLLAECAEVLARDPADYSLTVAFEPTRGVPRVCTYFPHGCADDCEVGIRIETFGCAPLAASDGGTN